ncbi:MAG TPA: DUF3365 domain-containing protein [Pirellulaceae bacterium]|nr:DUF3365 domain-containing protein [Pirellulaceae bacterium]
MTGGIRMGLVAAGLLGIALGIGVWAGAAAQEKKPEDAAVARTRKQVLMLDDLYKNAIVLITENYVQEDSDLAAGAAFQKLFEAMRKKGHHDVRLLDATGEPYNAKNLPRDEFEKAAVAALKSGKANYEQITEQNGKRVLRLATPIPVVMKKCTLCHPAYEKAAAGQPIGALGYTIAIE